MPTLPGLSFQSGCDRHYIPQPLMLRFKNWFGSGGKPSYRMPPIEINYAGVGGAATRRVAAVYACVSLLSSLLSQVRWSGVSVLDERMFDPRFDESTFWSRFYWDFAANGNGYLWIEKESGTPVRLWNAYVKGSRLVEGRILRTTATGLNQDTEDIDDKDMVSAHWAGYDRDCYESLSPITTAAASAINASVVADNQRIRALLRANRPYIQSKDPGATSGMSQADMQAMRDDVVSAFKDAGVDLGKVPQVPTGIALEGDVSLSDLMIVEQMQWNTEEISRVFAVPPRAIGHYLSGQRVDSNVENQSEDLYRYAVAPRIRRIQAQLEKKLFPDEDYMNGTAKITYDASSIREGSFDDRVRIYGDAYAKHGLITLNEAREGIGMGPTDGGDRVIVPKGSGGQMEQPEA